MLVELAVLKEKLLNQEQSNRQNELLREIQSLRETNNNMNQNNNVNNLDKMMQYMLMQQMLKTMNAPDPMLKEMLKEFNLNNKQTLTKELKILRVVIIYKLKSLIAKQMQFLILMEI